MQALRDSVCTPDVACLQHPQQSPQMVSQPTSCRSFTSSIFHFILCCFESTAEGVRDREGVIPRSAGSWCSGRRWCGSRPSLWTQHREARWLCPESAAAEQGSTPGHSAARSKGPILKLLEVASPKAVKMEVIHMATFDSSSTTHAWGWEVIPPWNSGVWNYAVQPSVGQGPLDLLLPPSSCLSFGTFTNDSPAEDNSSC